MAAPCRLIWHVQCADRNGKPTERTCRLPRMWWPGMAIFDYCGGPGSKDGRYVVGYFRSNAPNTFIATGFAFRNLRDLWAHLDEIRVKP